MKAGLKGSPSTLRQFKQVLKTLPTTIAHDVASRGAPVLTDLTREAFASGQTVYGDARPTGVSGNALTLQRTGDAARGLRFVATGTIMRCTLGPRYSKYLIGKYSILPNGAIPVRWRAKLADIVKATEVAL